MPLNVSCEPCGWKGKVKDSLAGKRVRCPGCGRPMELPSADYEVVDEDEDNAPRKKSRVRSADDDEADDRLKRRKQDADDEYDDSPRRKKRQDDDDPPRRRKQQDDEYDDRPSRRKRDDDDDGRPSRRKQQDDDEFDERPSRRKQDDDDATPSRDNPPRKAKIKRKDSGSEQKPPLEGGAAILAGLLMMVGAVVWFALGLIHQDKIYFYPPVLFVLGIISLVRGVSTLK